MRFSPAGKGRRLGAAATSPIKINEETYQPTIVASCEIAKESRSNMCPSRARFARTAITRAMPLTARSLFVVHVVSEQHIAAQQLVYHFGSRTSVPSASVEVLSTTTRQSMTKAQMLNAVAKGPNVPAIRGKRVEENHHRLYSC